MAERIYDIVEIKKRVSAKLKKEFPKYGFALSTRRGGADKLYVNWYRGDFYPFIELNVRNLPINHYYIKDDKRITYGAMRVMQKVKDITDEYNWDNSDMMTDYVDVNFYIDLYIGTDDKPFEVISTSSTPSATTSSENTDSGMSVNFDKGEFLRSDAGWSAYKKILPDGRVVYNVFKDKETAANKTDWNVIKGEVYIESGFKWSKYGFSKWGSITYEDIVLNALFDVLKKYYQSNVPQSQQQNANTNNQSTKFVYGIKYGVPTNDGQELIVELEGRGFSIIEFNKEITISKLGYPKVLVNDNGGEFSLDSDGSSTIYLRSIPYDKMSGIETPQNLAMLIDDVYFDELIYAHNNQNIDSQKEEVQTAITALQYLADAGDEDAKIAIKALQYLL